MLYKCCGAGGKVACGRHSTTQEACLQWELACAVVGAAAMGGNVAAAVQVCRCESCNGSLQCCCC